MGVADILVVKPYNAVNLMKSKLPEALRRHGG